MLTEKQIEKMTQKQAMAISDKQEAIMVVTIMPSLFNVMKNWQDDKEVAIAAIKRTAYSIEYVSDRLKDDEEIVLLAMEQNPRLLMEASKRLTDSNIMRAKAFKAYGHPFIVDKLAWNEFERLDWKLIKETTEYKQMPNGEVVEVYDEEKMQSSSFYKVMKKYYEHNPYNPLTAEDIRGYEEYLLGIRERRLKLGVKKRPAVAYQSSKK